MASTCDPGSPLAQAIQALIQPKLVENGWVADESDMSLAEYVISMVNRGSTKEQIILEMGTDLLGIGEDDPAIEALVIELLEQVPVLQAQISGKHNVQNSAGEQQQQQQQQHISIQTGDDLQMDEAAPTGIPSGPKAMREGTAAGSGRGRGRILGQLNRQMDRNGDDKIFRIKGAAGGTGRINSHAGRDANRRGRGNNMGVGRIQQQNGMPMMNSQQQMQLMQMMEMQNQMMAQMMNGQPPDMGAFNPNKGKSLFERIEKGGKSNKSQHITGPMNGSAPDVDMGEDATRKDPFDVICRFNDKCTVATCPYAHQSPAAPAGTAVDLTDNCSFGAACENRKCAGKHPSPAQRRQHLSADVDCKFYPNCTNPGCPFRHPDMPACRNGADCTVANCKFSHSKIMCRYNPCLNPTCVYKHADGQKRGKFEDKVWTRDESKTDRLKSLGEHKEQNEELIIPGNDDEAQDTFEQPVTAQVI